MPCSGDSEETCGGFYSMSVYAHDPAYLGCFQDSDSRIMYYSYESDSMTAEVSNDSPTNTQSLGWLVFRNVRFSNTFTRSHLWKNFVWNGHPSIVVLWAVSLLLLLLLLFSPMAISCGACTDRVTQTCFRSLRVSTSLPQHPDN